MPLLPLPSPPVNPGAPLRRIVTNGLGEACLGLQIAELFVNRDSESLYVQSYFSVPSLCIAHANRIGRR
jgi:hypothetical protein